MSIKQLRKGSLFVIAAPSGAGKTSLIRAVLDNNPLIQLSISHTTREQRELEQDGVHYHFVDVNCFEQMVAKHEFVEHARVFGNYYGTSAVALEAQLNAGRDVILEIDWQGAAQIRSLVPDCVGIFILPPSRQALQHRLSCRGQDSDQIIQQRMSEAVSEMSHYGEFDYVLVNDDFDQAQSALTTIIAAQGYRSALQKLNLAEILIDLVE